MSNIINDRLNFTDGIQTNKILGELYSVNKDPFGNEILKFVAKNTVTVSGVYSLFKNLLSDYGDNVDITYEPETINSILGINSTGINIPDTPASIVLFGVSDGGATDTFGTVYKPDVRQTTLYHSEGNTDTIIPMRRTAEEIDLNQYYMRRPVADTDGTVDYFLKKIKGVSIKTLSKNPSGDEGSEYAGTDEITPSTSDNISPIVSFMEFTLELTEDDIREYYEASNAAPAATKYNTLGLFTGKLANVGTDDEGNPMYDYVDVRLFSAITFDNKSLRTTSSGVYKYRIYGIV